MRQVVIEPGPGNLSGNPLFIDAENGNFRLSPYSPAIGAGTLTGAPSTDIEGNPRPNPEGSNPDMGAYEKPRAAVAILPFRKTLYEDTFEELLASQLRLT